MVSSLHWETTTSIKSRNASMLENQFLSDVKFLIGIGELEFPAHSYILSITSPVFCKIFYNSQQKANIIRLPNIESTNFRDFLKYIYTDEINITHRNVHELLFLAKKFQITHLRLLCGFTLRDQLWISGNDGIIADILSRRDIYECCEIKNKFIEFILMNQYNVTQHSINMRYLESTDLKTILKSDCCNLSEFEIFNMAMRWAASRCRREGLDVTPKNKRFILGDLFYEIRFRLMDDEDWSICLAENDEILTKNEIRDIINDDSEIPCSSKKRFAFRDYYNTRCIEFETYPSDLITNEKNFSMTFSTDKPLEIIGFQISINLRGISTYTDIFTIELFVEKKTKRKLIAKSYEITKREYFRGSNGDYGIYTQAFSYHGILIKPNLIYVAEVHFNSSDIGHVLRLKQNCILIDNQIKMKIYGDESVVVGLYQAKVS